MKKNIKTWLLVLLAGVLYIIVLFHLKEGRLADFLLLILTGSVYLCGYLDGKNRNKEEDK